MKTLPIINFIFLIFLNHGIAQCDALLLQSQTDIETLGCERVMGDLYIVDDNDGVDPITSLLPLRNAGLNFIAGDLVIMNCHQLKHLDGLDLIDSIGTQFIISDNDSLKVFNSDTLNSPFQFSHIDSILIVENNRELLEINGLNNLTTLNISLFFNNLDSLDSIGSFDLLKRIERLTLQRNQNFNSAIEFPLLLSITDSLIITENPILNNCSWIKEVLKSVKNRKFRIEENGMDCETQINGDTDKPVYSNCSEDQNIENIPGECIGSFEYTDPIVTDNTSISSYMLSIFSSKGELLTEREAIAGMSNSQDSMTLGENKIIYEAKDEEGNVGICQFIVTLVDVEPPQLAQEIQDTTIFTSPQNCKGSFSIEFPAVIENCQIIDSRIVVINLATQHTIYNENGSEGMTYNIDLDPGNYKVSLMVTDESMQSDTSNADINVIVESDVQLGECPTDITVESNISCMNNFTYTTPELINGCDNLKVLREIIDANDSIIINDFVQPGQDYTSNFSPGINQLVFTYINGDSLTKCTTTITAQKHQLEAISLSMEELDCNTFTGKINADVDTLTGTYFWNGPNNFTSDELSSEVSFPGLYTFTFTQENDCVSEYFIDVSSKGNNVNFDLLLGEINCEEGERKLILDRNLENFTYQWNGPDSFTSNLESPYIQSAGWYHLNAYGNFNCIGNDSIFIPNDIHYSYDLLIDGNSAEVILEGGTPPFTYRWDGKTGSTNISDLENGEHTLRIVDGLGCLNDINFEIMVSNTETIEEEQILIYPNPVSDYIHLGISSDKSISIYNTQGVFFMTDESKDKIDVSAWPKGIYFIKVSNRDQAEAYRFLKI